QAASQDTETTSTQFTLPPTPQPLVVLKSDKRSLTLDPQKNEVFDINAIDTQSIKSITVLKGEDAREAYGPSAADGVLIVRLVDNYVFSKPALIKPQITK